MVVLSARCVLLGWVCRHHVEQVPRAECPGCPTALADFLGGSSCTTEQVLQRVSDAIDFVMPRTDMFLCNPEWFVELHQGLMGCTTPDWINRIEHLKQRLDSHQVHESDIDDRLRRQVASERIIFLC